LLANLLLSDAVQTKFHRVIIDAPPRASTGFVNALCASTHLLIPTVLDRLSTDGVTSFLNDLAKLQPVLCPLLKLTGVLGTMKRTKTETMDDSEEGAIESLKELLNKKFGHTTFLWEDQIMPRMEAFARAAGVRVAFPDPAVAPTINALGEKIASRAPSRMGHS
jgi:cellulose biosynthesis protein BcsQ